MLKGSLVMLTKEMIFAGIDISSGRKPLTFVALNGEMQVMLQARWDISQVITHLKQFDHVILAVNLLGGRKSSSIRSQKISDDLKKRIIEADFKPYLTSNAPRRSEERRV